MSTARPTPARRITPRRLAALLLLAAPLSLSGCSTLHGNSADAPSFAPNWDGAIRMPEARSELTGFSETSRQIERNLGYQ